MSALLEGAKAIGVLLLTMLSMGLIGIVGNLIWSRMPEWWKNGWLGVLYAGFLSGLFWLANTGVQNWIPENWQRLTIATLFIIFGPCFAEGLRKPFFFPEGEEEYKTKKKEELWRQWLNRR